MNYNPILLAVSRVNIIYSLHSRKEPIILLRPVAYGALDWSQKKVGASMAVPPAPVWVPSQGSFAPGSINLGFSYY